jgi:hypothetical protein
MEKIFPSNFFKNHFNLLRTNFVESGIIETSYEKYREKTYLEENKQKYWFAQIALVVFQILSIIFAYTLVFKLITQLLPYFGLRDIVAGTITGLLLILLEIAKKTFLGAFVESIIRAKAVQQQIRVRSENAFLSLILVALSVFSSVEGARMWAYQSSDQTKEISTQNIKKADEIKQSFADKIKTIQGNIQALQAKEISRAWGLTPTESQSLQANRTEYNRLLDEQTKQLQKTDNQTLIESNQNTNLTNQNMRYMLITSILVEIFTLACISFIAYYLGFVFVEAQANGNLPKPFVETPKNEAINEQLNEILAYLKNLVTNDTHSTVISPLIDAIEEKTETSYIDKADNLTQNRRPRGYSIDYEKVADCLKKGLSIQETAILCRCSPSSVKAFKKANNL